MEEEEEEREIERARAGSRPDLELYGRGEEVGQAGLTSFTYRVRICTEYAFTT